MSEGGGESGGVAAARVSSIFIYPIKSCRGISLSQAPLSSTGFRWDRQWMVVNSKGRAITQRVDPKLALVETELPNEALSQGWEPNEHSYLVIKAPGAEALRVPLRKPSLVTTDGVSVWEWCGSAFDEGDEVAQWFSTYLGKPARLLRFNEATETRPVDANYASGYKVKFCDGYPFLVLSQGSLDALNALLKDPIPVNRFRPKLVDGCEGYAEDLWKEIIINKSPFYGVKLCSRCKIPTINQETAEMGKEPTVTLTQFRSDKVLLPNRKQKGNVFFGQNMVCADSLVGGGRLIRVGDPVYVIKAVPSCTEAAA